MRDLKNLVKANPKQKVEQSMETARMKELYKEISKLQEAVGKLEGEVFKPTDILFGGSVTPMVNLLDNSDFSYSHREGSPSVSRESELALAKWYTRAQTSQLNYLKNTNFTVSENAILRSGRLTEWEEDLEILEGKGATESITIRYIDYPAGTPVRFIGEGKNKCIVGNGDVILTGGVLVKNYLDNWSYPEIDEDTVYYIHSFVGRDTLNTVGAQRGYKITKTPGGSPLQVKNPETGNNEDYVHLVTKFYRNPPQSYWEGTGESAVLIDNDRFIRLSSTMNPFIYSSQGKPLWDYSRKILKTAGGHVLASPLTAKFVLLGNKLYFKMQIVVAPDPIRHVRMAGTGDVRRIYIPQHEYEGVSGYYYKMTSPPTEGSPPTRQQTIRVFRPKPLWCTKNTLLKGTHVRVSGDIDTVSGEVWEVVSSSEDYIELYRAGEIGTNVAVTSVSSNRLAVSSQDKYSPVTNGKYVRVFGTSLNNETIYQIVDTQLTPIGGGRSDCSFRVRQAVGGDGNPVSVTPGEGEMYIQVVEPPTNLTLEELYRRSPLGIGGDVSDVIDVPRILPIPKTGLKCKVSIWDNAGTAIFRGDKPVILAEKVGNHDPDLILTGIYKRDFTAYNSTTQRYTTTFSPYTKTREEGLIIRDLNTLSPALRTFEIVEKNSPIPEPLQSNTTYKLLVTQTGSRIQTLSGTDVLPSNTSAPISFTGIKRVYTPETLVTRDYILEVVMPDGRNFYSESEVFVEGQNRVPDTVDTDRIDSDDYVSITWTKVVGSSKYNIYRRVDSGEFFLIGSVPSSSDQFLDFGSTTAIPLPDLRERPPETETFFAEAVIENITDLPSQNLGRFYEIQAAIQFPSAITQFNFSGDQYLQIEFFKPGEGFENTDLSDIPANSLGIDKVALGYNYGRWAPSDYDLSIKPTRNKALTSIPNSTNADGTATTSTAGSGFVAGSDATQGGIDEI